MSKLKCPRCGSERSTFFRSMMECLTCFKTWHLPSFMDEILKKEETSNSSEAGRVFGGSVKSTKEIKAVGLSNDVWVSGKKGESSVGLRPLDGAWAGKMSGLPFDNHVRDLRGNITGKMTEIQGRQIFCERWW